MEREQLRKLLQDFDDSVPSLIKENPDDAAFRNAFSLRAGDLRKLAEPQDLEWTSAQIVKILNHFGKTLDYPADGPAPQ